MKKTQRIFVIISLFICLLTMLFACNKSEKQDNLIYGTADNEILTFCDNSQNRQIIRILTDTYSPSSTILDSLQAKFPQYLFVFDNRGMAGTNSTAVLQQMIQARRPMDMIITKNPFEDQAFANEYLVDFSADTFLNNYLHSALGGVSLNGHIYSLPGISTMTGIAYNVDLFEQNDWAVPTNIEEFFTLCDTISRADIRPFSACMKYESEAQRLFSTMCFDKLCMSPDDLLWLEELKNGTSRYKNHMEPYYELVEQFVQNGLLTIDDFTASLTKQRQSFWRGETAMMYYSSDIYSYAKAEEVDMNIGFMPFPAENSRDSGFYVMPNYYISLPKALELKQDRLDIMKEIVEFISSPQGQEALIGESISISNIKNVNFSTNSTLYSYIKDAYENGNLYPSMPYNPVLHSSTKAIFEGSTVDEAIKMVDDYLDNPPPPTATPYQKIASAKSDFSMLETSYYMADKLKDATASDIALVVNGGFYCSNLSTFTYGNITDDPRNYVLKGVSGSDYLTKYKLTGLQLKTLLENPIINDEEIDVFIAASGLKITYAPWNERGKRVIEVKLQNNDEIVDDALYTVSAWAGTIAPQYITEVVTEYPQLGTFENIIINALKRDKVVMPNISKRVTLIWITTK